MKCYSATDELYVGDVGQHLVESIDRVEISKNYGWNAKEGSFIFNGSFGVTADLDVDGYGNGDFADSNGLVDPFLEYDHDYGDGNLDRNVNYDDFVLVFNHFGNQGTSWSQGDFNLDRITNCDDFGLLTNDFESNGAVGSVPEATASIVLVMCWLAHLRASRRIEPVCRGLCS